MRHAPPLFIPSARLASSLLLVFAPALAAHADDSALSAAADATGMTIAVKNCNDSGAGSLRAAVANAVSGDVVDMRALNCTRIALTSGAIEFPQTNLTVRGPGWTKLTVTGIGRSSIFRQVLTQPTPDPNYPRIDGTLRLLDFTISWGRVKDPVVGGGCIFAHGRVVLERMQVHHCRAISTNPAWTLARGGAVYAWNDIVLIRSHVHSNRASHAGGGVHTWGKLTAQRSRVSHNSVDLSGGGTSSVQGLTLSYSMVDHNTAALAGSAAGGVSTAGATSINNSTIAYNHAYYAGAGNFDISQPTRIIQSTISHNTADSGFAGIRLVGSYQPAEVRNSTIVFNAITNPSSDLCDGAGVSVAGPVTFRSSIVAGNTCAGQPSNLGENEFSPPAQVVGSHNLIGTSSVSLPADTLLFDDPRLAPLANNGGPTMTHALLRDSPAIDRGSNPSGFQYDQRGEGFPRVRGVEADIGAFERRP